MLRALEGERCYDDIFSGDGDFFRRNDKDGIGSESRRNDEDGIGSEVRGHGRVGRESLLPFFFCTVGKVRGARRRPSLTRTRDTCRLVDAEDRRSIIPRGRSALPLKYVWNHNHVNQCKAENLFKVCQVLILD